MHARPATAHDGQELDRSQQERDHAPRDVGDDRGRVGEVNGALLREVHVGIAASGSDRRRGRSGARAASWSTSRPTCGGTTVGRARQRTVSRCATGADGSDAARWPPPGAVSQSSSAGQPRSQQHGPSDLAWKRGLGHVDLLGPGARSWHREPDGSRMANRASRPEVPVGTCGHVTRTVRARLGSDGTRVGAPVRAVARSPRHLPGVVRDRPPRRGRDGAGLGALDRGRAARRIGGPARVLPDRSTLAERGAGVPGRADRAVVGGVRPEARRRARRRADVLPVHGPGRAVPAAGTMPSRGSRSSPPSPSRAVST